MDASAPVSLTNGASKDRKSLATDLKVRGNKAYIERKFADAVKCYTRAIEVAPEPDPVFYSNRAASSYLRSSSFYLLYEIIVHTFRLHVLPKARLREGSGGLHRSAKNQS